MSSLVNLTALDLSNRYPVITGEALEQLTNITSLNVARCNYFPTYVVRNLKNVTELDLSFTMMISDETVLATSLHNLTSLCIDKSLALSNRCVSKLTNLRILSLVGNEVVSDIGITGLTNLTSLDISRSQLCTDIGVQDLLNLTSLSLRSNYRITNSGIKHLTKLLVLDLNDNGMIDDAGISDLLQLTDLNLGKDSISFSQNLITGAGLSRLSKLTSLDLSRHENILDSALCQLHNLTSLDLSANGKITYHGVTGLSRLVSLTLHGMAFRIDGFTGKQLTNLTHLRVRPPHLVIDEGLTLLTNLQTLELDMMNNYIGITANGIGKMTSLKSLSMEFPELVFCSAIARLTNLTYLDVRYPEPHFWWKNEEFFER
jgi:hypothetical protein